MKTRIFSTTTEDIKEAARIIASGGLVAFPTETVYGLGADAMNPEAVANVYAAKGRPSDNPMIVHIASIKDMQRLTENITDDMRVLMDAIWPGPLTMVVNKTEAVPYRTTGGLETVAVRMPANEAALALIRESGCPIAAPSANISGRPSPTRAADVIFDMDGRIEGIIAGEDCQVGIESTVLDMTGEVPTILRPGIVTAEKLEEVLGKAVEYDKALFQKAGDADFKPKSPGMKYKHYAPKADMVILSGSRGNVEAEIERIRSDKEAAGVKTGVILFEDNGFEEAAHDLFARLRDMDEAGVDLIIAGALSTDNQVGFAVMNRMVKSAGYNIIEV
ncbi:MAG: threonylcarbamoyl-AMP synthase [Eubacterium sp.]|nr:threonylcarbamoyl-AMP synthase [Candidatus Colimonas fimequi]